jgi:predicted MFS family arabinose efflux permease
VHQGVPVGCINPVGQRAVVGAPGRPLGARVGVAVPWRWLVVLSVLYTLACRLLQLIVPVSRSERSKDPEIRLRWRGTRTVKADRRRWPVIT